MNLLLALKFWREIAIAALVALLVFMTFTLRDSANTLQLMRVNNDLQKANNIAEQSMIREQMERKYHEQTIQAVNEAKKREQVIIADAASARDAAASLSDTIDKLSANAAADANFRIEYSRTTGNLLKECLSQYIEMAETADRISNSLRAIEQANKRK